MHSLYRRLRDLSRFPILTHPSRLACARLQGGLNNFAPDGAGLVIALEFDLQAAHAPVPQGRYNL